MEINGVADETEVSVEMKQLSIKEGILYLDGEKIPNLKSFNIASSTKGSNIVELTICIDVLFKDFSKQTEPEQQ